MCHYCNIVGHFARVCKSRQAQVPTSPPAKNLHGPTIMANLIRIEAAKLSSIRSRWILSNNITEPAPTISTFMYQRSTAARLWSRLISHRPRLAPSQCTATTCYHQTWYVYPGKSRVTRHSYLQKHATHLPIADVLLSWKVSKALRVLPPTNPLSAARAHHRYQSQQL